MTTPNCRCGAPAAPNHEVPGAYMVAWDSVTGKTEPWCGVTNCCIGGVSTARWSSDAPNVTEVEKYGLPTLRDGDKWEIWTIMNLCESANSPAISLAKGTKRWRIPLNGRRLTQLGVIFGEDAELNKRGLVVAVGYSPTGSIIFGDAHMAVALDLSIPDPTEVKPPPPCALRAGDEWKIWTIKEVFEKRSSGGDSLGTYLHLVKGDAAWEVPANGHRLHQLAAIFGDAELEGRTIAVSYSPTGSIIFGAPSLLSSSSSSSDARDRSLGIGNPTPGYTGASYNPEYAKAFDEEEEKFTREPECVCPNLAGLGHLPKCSWKLWKDAQ